MAKTFLLVLGCFLLSANLIFLSIWLHLILSREDGKKFNCVEDLERVIDIRSITIPCALIECLDMEPNSTVKRIVNWFDEFIPEGYDRHISSIGSDRLLAVKISAYVIEMTNFDPISTQVDAHMYMRQHWKDSRLRSEFTKAEGSVSSREGHNLIWVPDLFVQNAFNVHKPEGPNAFLRIEPDGSVIYSQKMHIRIPCKTDHKNFPFESLRCRIVFESFGMTNNVLSLSWLSKPGYSPRIVDETSPQLHLERFNDDESNFSSESGNYSQVAMEFKFSRNPGYFLESFIPPTVGIFLEGYSCFFMNAKSVTTKIGLCSMAIMVNLLYLIGFRSHLPRISSCMGIDVWSFITLAFIAFSMCESLVVHKMHAWKEGNQVVLLDRLCRIFYPIALIIVVSVFYGVYVANM